MTGVWRGEREGGTLRVPPSPAREELAPTEQQAVSEPEAHA
jgi:hypothetical protein